MQDDIVATTAAPGTQTFRCSKPKCGKAFNSEQALRMHMVRMHTRAGLLGAKLGQRLGGRGTRLKTSRMSEGLRERRRAYNARLRASFIAQGLTSQGKPRKRPLKGLITTRVVPKSEAWRERQRARQREWYYKNKNKIQIPPIVYPIPGTTETPRIKYCPYCKGDIERLIHNE